MRIVAARNGLVYVLDNDPPYPPHMSALDAVTGEVRWHYHHSASLVKMPDDRRIVIMDGETGDFCWRVLDAATGAVVAQPYIPVGLWVIAITETGVIYGMMGDAIHPRICYAYHLDDGAQIWNTEDAPETERLHDPVRASGVITTGTLCYGAIILDQRVAEVTGRDAASGRKLWQWHSPAGITKVVNAMHLVGTDGTVFLATNIGVFALRASDGTLLWHALPDADLTFITPIVVHDSA
jgi:outer membrane protein assembly factor BamB